MDIRSIGCDRAFQILRLLPHLAFVLVVSMVSLYEGILLWFMGWADLWLDPQTLQEPQQGRRKILRRPTADPPRIAVEADPIRAALGHQHLRHRSKRGLRCVVTGWFGGDHRR